MPRPRNTSEVLWSKVDKKSQDECWEWKGWRNEQGYGRYEIDGKSYYAHRAIYNLAHPGKITLEGPKNRNDFGFLRHTCDNPPCCNPYHLIPGTHAENMNDSKVRNRRPDYKGEKGPRSKLTNEEVFFMRMQRKYGAPLIALEMLYGVSRATIHSVIYNRHYKTA